jgi:oligopeptide transport system substrate-binding protein
VYSKELPPEELGIEAVDDYTLRIYTEVPTPYLPAIGVWFAVAPQHAYEQFGENWALDPEKFISSGPWILAEFERGVKHTWKLNTNYKGVRMPYMIEVRERTLPTGLPAYIAGDIQGYGVSGSSPAGEVGLINADPTLRAESHPQPSTFTEYIGFNTLEGRATPLENPDVRLALCKAVDKETLVGQIHRGFANPAYGVLPNGFPNYIGDQLKELDANKYDPEAAKALLSNAGYPDGKGFPVFEMWIRQPNDTTTALAQAVQARWKENLGIQVELKPADFQSFTAASFGDKTAPIYNVQYALDYYDPATFLNVFRNGGRHPVENPEWTEEYNKANAILDPAERFKQLADAEIKLVESTQWLFLAHPFTISIWPCNLAGWAVQPNKDGFQFNGGGGASGCPHAYEGLYWADKKCR